MSLQHQAVDGPVHFILDVLGGNYRIATQSLNEVLIDGRKTHNKTLLPKMTIDGSDVKLLKHQLLPWFNTARGVEATVLVPDGSSVTIKMYSGNVKLSGKFEMINVNLRHGDVTLTDGFMLHGNSLVKIASGNMNCSGLAENGFNMPWQSKKITSIDHENGASLRVELRLGELVFS